MEHQHPFVQFPDLPQIPDENHLAQWPQQNNCFSTQIFQSPADRSMFLYHQDMDRLNPTRNHGVSIHRYLHGDDPTPFVAGMHRPSVDLSRSVGLNTYDPPYPASDCHLYAYRDGSPGRTSVSVASSHDTSNELRSPQPYQKSPYGSPNEQYYPTLSYPSPQHSHDGIYPHDYPLHGGICPRDVELEHTMEDQDAELADPKGEFQYPHDQTHSHDQPQYYANHSQADMDQDDCDSKDYLSTHAQFHREESVKPAAGSSEDSDPEYNPKRNGKRNNSSSSGSGRPKRVPRSRKGSVNSPPALSTRVTKRPQKASNTSPSTKSPVTKSPKSPTSASRPLHADTHRYFPCPLAIYGCISTFTSKNEWKRHMSTQHIKLGFWRCDLCTTGVDPNDEDTVYHNDFNRKDLFTQHLRRMHADPKLHTTGGGSWRHTHAPNKVSSSASNSASTSHSSSPSVPAYPVTDENIPAHQTRCFKMLRQTPPRSSCLFCHVDFSGPSGWDERMEHVGRHLEKERKPQMLDSKSWREDPELQNWLVEEGLIAWSAPAAAWRIGDGKPRRDSILEGNGMEE